MTSWAPVRAARAKAPRDRVVIDGVDVTYWRMTRPGDQPITPQGYALTEPFAYGAASLTIPRINPQVEQLGVGDRSWIRTGALVKYERVWYDDDETTILDRETDYRGVIVALQIRGSSLTLDIQGDLAGRLALMDRQPPVFRRLKDIGDWAFSSIINEARQQFTPLLGPVTGIKLPNQGGMTELAWLEYLCAMSQNDAGEQRTIMPTTWGKREWAFLTKDRTTVDLTVFADGHRISLDVSDDAAEQPNVWYGNGQAMDGQRWRNAKAPGITAGDPPAYPMAGGAPFGIGTTDGSTTSGSGVSTLHARLIQMGYLDLVDAPNSTIYTAAVAEAVKKLQADAHLTQSGSIGVAGWNNLFDLEVTGYSFAYAEQHPLVQDPSIPYWIYTANGSVSERNDDYDPLALRVDRSIDFGTTEKKDGVRWTRGAYKRAQGKNWVGTLRLNGFGGYAGEHDGTTQPDDSDIMPIRDIRPGMNVWMPYFDGGTLFHIAGVTIDEAGTAATLTIDTQARDLLELRQIIERNRESRRDLRREWAAVNRRKAQPSTMPTWDEIGGRLDYNKALTGDKWTVFPIPVGQQGQVNRITLGTFSTPTKFAVAIFAKRVYRSELAKRIGNPLAKLGPDEVAWYEDEAKIGDWLDARWLLYAAGDEQQPCGYWPRKHTNDAGTTTSAPVTGRWQDDAAWPYICAPDEPSVVWVAIYADQDSNLGRGRILWKQEDDAI